MQNITILGATGSIGQSTLKLVRQHAHQYRVVAVSAFSNLPLLLQIVKEFKPQMVALPQAQIDTFYQLCQRELLATATSNKENPFVMPQLVADEAGLVEISTLPQVNIVMAAIVGAAGLAPTYAAIKAGKKVLLANKESLVMAGQVMMQAVAQYQATLLPVDSEHNAIFQCLPKNTLGQAVVDDTIHQLILTASGGPFRTFTLQQLQNVTPQQACKHPNWSMGQKISVDSASLMNKGLELIEACHLFLVPQQRIEVVVHPQSIIHSMVEYVDGSVLAQLGTPDMCTPISYAMAYPQRIDAGVQRLNWRYVKQLDFEDPDTVRFPCLQLARDAMHMGGTAPAILNAANEVAVQAFLNQSIQFSQIPQIISHTLTQLKQSEAHNIDTIFEADVQARGIALKYSQQLSHV